MPKNPYRAAQGGDVEGTTRSDVTEAVGSPIEIARAAFEPGYDLTSTLECGGVAIFKRADLLRGFCDYGACIGDAGSDKAR